MYVSRKSDRSLPGRARYSECAEPHVHPAGGESSSGHQEMVNGSVEQLYLINALSKQATHSLAFCRMDKERKKSQGGARMIRPGPVFLRILSACGFFY